MDLVYRSVGVESELHAQPRLLLAPGMYWPYRVTKDPGGSDYSRTVDIPSAVSGVAPGTAVEMPLATGLMDTDVIEAFWVDRHTSYDASQMRLQLIQRDQSSGAVTILWEQAQSNDNWHAEYIAYNLSPIGLAFRVTAVPEPSGALALIAGVLGVAARWRRRKGC